MRKVNPKIAGRLLRKLAFLGRRQTEANTCTARPVTLFQEARYDVGDLPYGVEFDFDRDECDFVLARDVDTDRLDRWIGRSLAEFTPGYDGEEFTLSAFDLFEAGSVGRGGYPSINRTWATVMVFGSVAEALTHGDRCAHRYRAAGRGNGKLGRDWRVFTVPAHGLLGDLVSWAMDHAKKNGVNR